MRCWHTCHNNIVIAGAHAKCNSWKCLSNLLHKVRILLLQQLCHYLNVSNLMNILLRLKKKRWENNETNKQINKYQQQQQKKPVSLTCNIWHLFLPWSIPVGGDQDTGSRWGKVFYDKICWGCLSTTIWLQIFRRCFDTTRRCISFKGI